MALPILASLAAKGIVITWKTVAAVVAGGAAVKVAHSVGKSQGEYEGERQGRTEQAKVDEKKFRDLANEMLKQKKTYATAKKEWDEILQYYEDYINAAKDKYNITPEEEQELENVIKEYELLRKLKNESSNKRAKKSSTEDSQKEVSLNEDPFIEDKMDYCRALTASLYYFAKCDDSISKEEEELLKVYVSAIIYNPNLSDEAAGDLIEIKNKEISFADVKEYLDAVKNEDLTEIKKLIQSVIIASEGINQAEREAFSRFIKYYNQRLKV